MSPISQFLNVGGSAASALTPLAAAFYLAAPLGIGMTAGGLHYGLEKPSDKDFDNVGKEMIVAELAAQRDTANRLRHLAKMRKKNSSPMQENKRSIRM